jgi:hypothetical protein
MKVVYIYRQSIMDKIASAKQKSDEDGTYIDYIEITRDEAMELKKYCRDILSLHSLHGTPSVHNIQFMGITIKVEGCTDE